MYSAMTLAHYFVKKLLDAQMSITPIKIEFMVYFAHGWHLAIDGRGLITEDVCAWKQGPAIRSIKSFYKGKPDVASTLDQSTSSEIKESSKEFLDGICLYYRHLNEVEMQSLCLDHDTPWGLTYEKSSKELYIDNRKIKQHYKLLHISNPEFCDLDDPISVENDSEDIEQHSRTSVNG